VQKYLREAQQYNEKAERYVRKTLKAYGWTQEPTFHGYVEEYLW
jgi:hypothetical protein